MKRLFLIAFLAGMTLAPAWADYDAAGEAREAAQRKAEQQEAARQKAAVERRKADANMKYQREFVGADGKGKSDAEVTRLYKQKMAVMNRQAAEGARMTQGLGKAAPGSQEERDAMARGVTGKSTAEFMNMSPQEADALAREMQRKYGK